MNDIRNYTLTELESIFKGRQIEPYRGRQVFAWVYKRGAASFDKMSNLSCPLRNKLKEDFLFSPVDLIKIAGSKDGTKKFLFRFQDGNIIESVFIPAKNNRFTLCLSTQAGCKYSCVFCASGLAGFKRNLLPWEILAQILEIKRAIKGKDINHIVFMGMGEPLDNYDNVLKAARIINSKEGLNIGARKITISSAGIIPGIERLEGEKLQVELSISLHAPSDEIRGYLMPVNKKYPLAELINACKRYSKITRRQVTFEYVLIKGVNSSLNDAKGLSRLLKGWDAKVNIIPYNPVKELPYQPPAVEDVRIFRDCIKSAGVPVTIRVARGKDIEGACGQLRGKMQ